MECAVGDDPVANVRGPIIARPLCRGGGSRLSVELTVLFLAANHEGACMPHPFEGPSCDVPRRPVPVRSQPCASRFQEINESSLLARWGSRIILGSWCAQLLVEVG